MEGGAMNTCLRVLKETKWILSFSHCLLKFIEYFPDYLSALSRTLLRFFWTTFVKTAVYIWNFLSIRLIKIDTKDSVQAPWETTLAAKSTWRTKAGISEDQLKTFCKTCYPFGDRSRLIIINKSSFCAGSYRS